MKIRSNKTGFLLCALCLLTGSTVADAYSTLGGSAELSYNSFEASRNGEPVYSGNSLTQNYVINWTTSNLVQRNQKNYYIFGLGYDWLSFKTKTNGEAAPGRLSDSFGKFLYGGAIGYDPDNLPITFRANMDNSSMAAFRKGIYTDILADNFAYSIEGKQKSITAGFTFTFIPEKSVSPAIRGLSLPRLYINYQEYIQKSEAGAAAKVDNMTKELSVAGLNKGNNWLIYRSVIFDDHINSSANYFKQQMQIGLVDNSGRRKWSSLTNWIEISADGQFTQNKGADKTNSYEEYDVNFFAIASRKTWEARTFLNYNRFQEIAKLSETTRVPIYIKGIWGAETNWYVRISNEQAKENYFTGKISHSQNNSLSLGATTFSHSLFTLSPSISINSSKSFYGQESLGLAASVESNSTSRFSNKLLLSSYYKFSYLDNFGTSNSSFDNSLFFGAHYNSAANITYELKEELQHGYGSNYIHRDIISNISIGGYTRSVTSASAWWTKSAGLSTSLSAKYDYLLSDTTQSAIINLTHRISYNKNDNSLNHIINYSAENEGTSKASSIAANGDYVYRPDRYHDFSLRYNYTYLNSINNNLSAYKSSVLSFLQRYNHYYFTNTGVLRNYATISEEISITRPDTGVLSKYLLLSGRYSPTERISLYGSFRIQDDAGGIITMVYNAGVSADFRLLTSSIDYAYAIRDVDKKLEKKLSASVNRRF